MLTISDGLKLYISFEYLSVDPEVSNENAIKEFEKTLKENNMWIEIGELRDIETIALTNGKRTVHFLEREEAEKLPKETFDYLTSNYLGDVSKNYYSFIA